MKKAKRERYIPANATEYKAGNYTMYAYQKEDGTLLALCYRGKAAKANWHYRFKTEAQRTEEIEKCMKRYEEQAKQNAENEFKNMQRAQLFNAALQPGVILYYSWGYDQTNVDFFEVVGRKGKSTVILRPLNRTCGPEDSFMSAKVMPNKGDYSGPAFEKRIKTNYDCLSMSFGIAKMWEGEAMRISWYA